ncbi:MAG: hypothetical protein QM528_03640 [Phycisphaerales bacterium]|nr:hypothetical protein [Phycisphaerales bacterium]
MKKNNFELGANLNRLDAKLVVGALTKEEGCFQTSRCKSGYAAILLVSDFVCC